MNQPTTQNASRTLESLQTRILIALWALEEATKSELKANLVRRREKETSSNYKQRAESYMEALSKLEGSGAFTAQGRKLVISDTGYQLLTQGLLNSDFTFDAQIGAKTANSLLRWIRQQSLIAAQVDSKKSTVLSTYEEFSSFVLSIFDRLNQDFNLNNLVPIYRVRREVSDRVARNRFDQWLLEMQSHDVVQLIGGEMPELTPDKAEDSIKTALGGIRYYMKRL